MNLIDRRSNLWVMNPDGTFRNPETMEEYYRLNRLDNNLMKTMVGDVWVSTVFLLVNHGTQADPILFETMTFDESGGKNKAAAEFHESCWRYRTCQEALEGHKQVMKEVYEAQRELHHLPGAVKLVTVAKKILRLPKA